MFPVSSELFIKSFSVAIFIVYVLILFCLFYVNISKKDLEDDACKKDKKRKHFLRFWKGNK